MKKATYIEELDGLPAVSEVAETPETYPTDEANGDVPMQDQTKNGEGDWKMEAQSAPKEPKKKYDWVGVVKKCKRTKWKRTDVAATTSGTLGLAAHALPKRMDEKTEIQVEMCDTKCRITNNVDVPREVRRQELVGAFLSIGYGISTEAELRIALTNMGVIRDGGRGVYIGMRTRADESCEQRVLLFWKW